MVPVDWKHLRDPLAASSTYPRIGLPYLRTVLVSIWRGFNVPNIVPKCTHIPLT